MATTTAILSSTGLGSGLDVNAIVDKLMTVESRPLTFLKTQATELNARLSSFGKLQSYFSAMRDKANALSEPALWQGTTATSSSSEAVKATSASDSTEGNFEIQVDKLASGQMVSSPVLPGSGATLSPGQITIELGKWIDTPAPMFDPKVNSPAVTISIGTGETALSTVRDKINAAGAGVVATIINDVSGARLTLRSKETGEENAFRIQVAEAADDGQRASGLSMLAYDAFDAQSPMARSVAASNAQAKVNGIAVASASNTLTDVVQGVSLTLQKTTTAPVQVGVTRNTAAIKTAVTDFVSAFNSVAGFIRSQTAYNADTKVGGDLQGDQGTLALQNQLRAVINEGSSASSAYSRLSDVGIAMKSDGTLEINATKLDAALASKPDEVRKLMATDGAGSADSGFVRRFKRLADAALGSDGVFDSRTSGLRTSVQRNNRAQEAIQQKLDLTESRLRKQYQSLDTTMTRMNALSSYVSQQMSRLNG